MARSVTRLAVVPRDSASDPQPKPPRRGTKKIITGIAFLVVGAILYIKWPRISGLWTQKVYVACNFRQPGHSGYIRGKAINIYRFLPDSDASGTTTYRIAEGGGARIARNQFVRGDPNEDFTIFESRCVQADFDIKKYKLQNVCPDDTRPEGDKRTFFVLASGSRKSSPRPTQLQVRCADDSFDYFEDREAENPPRPKPPAPLGHHGTTRTEKKGGHKPPQKVGAPRPACSRPGRCERVRFTSSSPPASPPSGWIGPR